MEIFGVRIKNTTKEAVMARIEQSMSSRTPLRIATLNPEYLLLARKDQRFRESLRQADMRVVDGFGIQLVAWLKGVKLVRYPGADLVLDLLALAEQGSIPVVILNNRSGLSSDQEILKSILTKHPKLSITVVSSTQLPVTGYQLLICSYGAPSQEFALDEYTVPSLKMGVGGALDFLTGKQTRAPQVLRTLGLEWLWRLILQPKRLRRIWNAVAVFPFLAILDSLGSRASK